MYGSGKEFFDEKSRHLGLAVQKVQGCKKLEASS
jgi:hypothetical protein